MNGDQKKENNEVKYCGDEKSQTTINKTANDTTAENKANTEVVEAIEGMSPEMKNIFGAFMSISRPMLSPLQSKITESHIDKLIENGDKDNERMYKDNQHSRKFMLIYVLIGVFLFVFLTLFLVGKDPDLFKEILKLFITFVGGMGAGFGIKHYLEK